MHLLKPTLTVLVLLLALTACYSQSKHNLEKADFFYTKADSLTEYGNYSLAINNYKKAGAKYFELDNFEKKIKCDVEIGKCLWKLGKYDAARDVLHNSLKDCKKWLPNSSMTKSHAYNQLAIVESKTGLYELAMGYNLKSLKISRQHIEENSSPVANTYNNIAILHWYQGKFDSAIYYMKKVLNIRVKVFGKDHSEVAGAYNNLGMMILKTNSFDKGLTYLEHAARIREKLYGSDHVSLYNPYKNMASSYVFKNEYDKALNFNYKALEIARRSFGENHINFASIQMNIAIVYLSLDEFEKSLTYFKKSIAILNTIFEKDDHIILAQAHRNLGTLYANHNKYLSALKSFNRAIDIYTNKFGDSHFSLSDIFLSIADVYHKRNMTDSALYYCERSIETNLSNRKNAKYNFSKDKHILLSAYFRKASLLYNKHSKNNNYKHLHASMDLFTKCDSLMDNNYLNHTQASGKYLVRPENLEILRSAVSICLQTGLLKQDNKLLERAFHFAQKDKASVLKNALQSNYAIKYAQLTKVDLELEEQLRSETSFLMSRIRESTGNVEALNQQLFELIKKRDSVIDGFEKKYPKYYQLKYSTRTASVKDVQNHILNSNDALVEYFMSDSSLYIFAVTKNNHEVKQVKKGSAFNQQLRFFQNALRNPNLLSHQLPDYQQYLLSASLLYDYLIAPIDSLIKDKQLIIVPDGELALIPFEALLTKKVSRTDIDYSSLPYLIKRQALSYANSTTLLLSEKENYKPIKGRKNRMLAFAPTFSNSQMVYNTPDTTRDKLGPLNWTDYEVKNISSYFDSRVYLDSNATERMFKLHAKNYEILHLASHGMVDTQNPMNSKIAFSEDKKDTLNDGYMHTFELYGTQLNAEMAVLSACNTGYGKVLRGEGILNLARGFFYSGCKSVVMSLWVANDQSTATIMSNFYRQLDQGNSKHIALQKAKLEYLNSSDGIKAHPYYWSQFIITGSTRPIKDYSFSFTPALIVVGIGLLTLIMYHFIRRNLFS